jgi:hypothetical protein
LRQAGLVETTRVGKWIYYRIAEPKNELESTVLQETANWLANDEQIKQDHARLVQISCCETNNIPIAIKRGPRSLIFEQSNISEGGPTENKPPQAELADYLL